MWVGQFARLTAVISMNAAPANEFARSVAVAGLGRKAGPARCITATPEECSALADRFDLVSVGSLAANVSCAVVDPRRGRVRAYGSLRATDVIQRGVLRDEVPSALALEANFETFFVDEEAADQGLSGSFDSEEDETYDEIIENGQIDIGELVAQHFYLTLSDEQLASLDDYAIPGADGTIVLDTDPDLPDLGPDDGSGPMKINLKV